MTMTTMPPLITAGVDTHLDVHVAAALDERGGLLGVESFGTTPAGYRQLVAWLRGFGELDLVGVEGTGSYGAGLTRHLHGEGVRVVEVDRPNRQRRRRRGKSDPQDAITAARAAQSGDPTGKPEPIRTELRALNVYRLIERASSYRPGDSHDRVTLTKFTLRMLARRARDLEAEITDLDTILAGLVAQTAPALIARTGIGVDNATALLVAAGDNPERLRNEATFAHLCGAAPIDASSGKHERHRLNRGGDRQANCALWRIVLTRMTCDPRTRGYIERRMKQGLTKKEAIRCLKRYIAREVYNHLPAQLALDNP
jgi:transposase